MKTKCYADVVNCLLILGEDDAAEYFACNARDRHLGDFDIDSSLMWYDTPQGKEYWKDLHDRVQEMRMPKNLRALCKSFKGKRDAKKGKKAIKRMYLEREIDSATNKNLCCAFTWGDTKEGYAFWYALSLNTED